MTNLADLWQRRFKNHISEIGKYARLILNDHFSMILFILFAFGAIYYQELFTTILTMDPETTRMPIILVAVFWLSLVFQIGRPIWYTRDSDKSYLFARGHEWDNYWFKGTLIGAILPSILLAGASVLAYPFLTVVTAWQSSQMGIFILFSVIFKLLSFIYLYLNIYKLGIGVQRKPVPQWQFTLIYAVIILISMMVPAPFHWIVPVLTALALTAYALWALTQRSTRQIEFEYVIEQDVAREASFYTLVSVFADVPQRKPAIRRRPYLDRILKFVNTLNRNRYSYLYMRMLLRNSTYSGIWLKVMVFVAVLIATMESIWFALIIGLLGYIMTIVQLVPMMYDYDKNPFQQLYPNRAGRRTEAFRNTMAVIFSVQSAVYIFVLLIFNTFSPLMIMVPFAWILWAGILLFAYIPWWNRRYIKKHNL